MTDEHKHQCERQAIIRAVAILSEHFDCVQIFANYANLQGTHVAAHGIGNALARKEQVRQWLMREDMAFEFQCGMEFERDIDNG